MKKSFDIFLAQGGGWDMLTFLTEPPLLIESSNPTSETNLLEIFTVAPHCFEEGDKVLVFHNSGCSDDSICTTVMRITSCNSFTVDLQRKNSGGTSGFVAKPINLNGMYFRSNIRNRDFVTSPYPVLGAKVSGKAGDNRLLVCGKYDISIGDRISVPSMGITNSKVINILVNKCEPEPDPCCPVGVCKALVINSLIQTTRYETNDLKVEGGNLLPLDIDVVNPECGYIHLSIKPHTSISLGYNINTQQCDNKDMYYKVGKYNIFSISGFGDKVPPHYCLQPNNAPYNNNAFLLGEGDVFVKPTYVDFSEYFPN